MNECENCLESFEDPEPGSYLVAPGGWCAPSDQTFSLMTRPVLCPDCDARWTMVMMLGIDPGKNGENLRIPRGSIKFEERA